jgi:hypothetical protein
MKNFGIAKQMTLAKYFQSGAEGGAKAPTQESPESSALQTEESILTMRKLT